jgi:hypothetical protein
MTIGVCHKGLIEMTCRHCKVMLSKQTEYFVLRFGQINDGWQRPTQHPFCDNKAIPL